MFRAIFHGDSSSKHFRHVAFLEVSGFRQVRVPQTFAGHLVVEDALALMHHEEPLVTMHDDVRVAQDGRASRLDEEAGLARGDPDGAESGEDGGPHLPQSQTLCAERRFRLLPLLLDPPETGDQWTQRSSKPLLRLGQILRSIEIRHRGGSHGHGERAEKTNARLQRYSGLPGQAT